MADSTLTMPKNEEGEFELILGNKQLLSVFFIVVILLGVFFTMGYIVGRNSGPVDTGARQAPPTDVNSSSGGKSAMPQAQPASKPLEVMPSPTVTAPKEKTPETTTAVIPTTPAPAPVVSTPKPAAPVQETPKPVAKPLEVSPVTPAVTVPQPGTSFIQVRAMSKDEAEVLATVLARKGMHTVVAPGPNEKIFRVLVGPAKDAADLGRMKGDLEQAGFKDAFVKKY
jgi:cell division septation protein DedD